MIDVMIIEMKEEIIVMIVEEMTVEEEIIVMIVEEMTVEEEILEIIVMITEEIQEVEKKLLLY
jgi:hypothetical protein